MRAVRDASGFRKGNPLFGFGQPTFSGDRMGLLFALRRGLIRLHLPGV